MRRVAGAVGVAALAAFGVGVVGFDAAHMVLVAAGVLAVAAVTGDPGTDPRLPPLPAPAREGARADVTELSWLVGEGGVAPGFVRRLRAVARRRLADAGVDASDPAAVAAVLGPDAAAALTAAAPSERDVARCLTALESLRRTA